MTPCCLTTVLLTASLGLSLFLSLASLICTADYVNNITLPTRELRKTSLVLRGRLRWVDHGGSLEQRLHIGDLNSLMVPEDACSEPAVEPYGIPKIIHQSWKDESVPHKYQDWQSSWQLNHPDWEYRLWTDADNRALIQSDYPWFLDIYDSLPRSIMKADVIRYFYMLKYGGLYVDLDFESLQALDPLTENASVLLAYMGKDHDFEHNIPNAFMASVPGHPFWWYCISKVMLSHIEDDRWDYIEATTGPAMLKEALIDYTSTCRNDITILPSETIYPFDWHKTWLDADEATMAAINVCVGNHPAFDADRCKEQFPGAYAITYWTHSWAP